MAEAHTVEEVAACAAHLQSEAEAQQQGGVGGVAVDQKEYTDSDQRGNIRGMVRSWNRPKAAPEL